MVGDKFGALPLLSLVFDYGPLFAAGVEFLVDFLVIGALMYIEGIPPWKRGQYKTFLWFGGVLVPIYLAVTTLVLQEAPELSGFYTERWWHILLLIIGFSISLGLEVSALRNGQYTLSQELSPSKLWHTLIFGIVFYWVASSVLPVLLVHRPLWAIVIVVATLVGLIYPIYLDSIPPHPKDAHLEGSWRKWDWHRRTY